jgi:hypothetical protein
LGEEWPDPATPTIWKWVGGNASGCVGYGYDLNSGTKALNPLV